MAGDLIPPPSPSGRPSPDAMRNVSRRGNAELVEIVEPEAAAASAPEPSQFRSRFGFVLGALVGVSVAAVAAFALVLGTGSSKPAGAVADHWSTWFPPTRDIFGGPGAIADHVQAEYKRADGKQLVLVHGGPLIYTGTSPVQFAVQLMPADGSILDLGSNGVLYSLTGAGKTGQIVDDKPTPERKRLLRREALELALYSFRYVDNITMFVALMPDRASPPKAAKGKAKAKAKAKAAKSAADGQEAVFFRPGDLKRELQTPLARTLKPATKLKPQQVSAIEAKRVDKLTHENLFTANFVPSVDGRLYLVLKSSPR